MTPDDIRKLLSGYATDALTGDERKLLFDAALDDQELFNALQHEDALRELLADPLSRDAVRKVLEQPKRDTHRGGFWSRRWMFGVAIPAVDAVIVIAVLKLPNAPGPIPPVQPSVSPKIAQDEPSAKLEAVRPEAKPQAKKLVKPKALDRIASNVSPVIPAPIQLEPRDARRDAAAPRAFGLALPGQAGQQQSQGVSSQQVAALKTGAPQIPDAIRQQFSAGFLATAPRYQGPLVRYSLIRSGAAGESVRVEVSTGVAGYLALYQVDAAGNPKHIYPEGEPAMLVLPDITIQIPSNPIKIGASGKLRLVLVPTAQPSVIGQLGGAVSNAVQKEKSEPEPLVIDIPLAQN
jgi:hypothetical protein